jgi:hypothetical protein
LKELLKQRMLALDIPSIAFISLTVAFLCSTPSYPMVAGYLIATGLYGFSKHLRIRDNLALGNMLGSRLQKLEESIKVLQLKNNVQSVSTEQKRRVF